MTAVNKVGWSGASRAAWRLVFLSGCVSFLGVGLANALPPPPLAGLAPSLVLKVAVEEERSALVVDDELLRHGVMVGRIQEVLTDLGIFAAPITGVFDAPTERAIRIYQGQVDLDVDGQATRELLDHLETIGRGNRLVIRIAVIRSREMDEARQALSSRQETLELLADDALETADPTRDSTACFLEPTAKCLLGEALESAKGIADSKFRDWALGDLVVAQARAGLDEDAFRTAAKIEDPRLIIAALSNISQAQAASGRLSEARAMAEMVPDQWERLGALASIAVAEALSGNSNDAFEVARAVWDLAFEDGSPRAVSALTRLAIELRLAGSQAARALAELHAIPEALETAGSISDDGQRARTLWMIGIVQKQSGQSAEATLARAYEAIENIGSALTRAWILSGIASASAEAGETTLATEAFSAAQDIHSAWPRTNVLTRLATILVEIQ